MHQNLSRNLVGLKYKGWHEGKPGFSFTVNVLFLEKYKKSRPFQTGAGFT
jgi:hypothetical protein